MSKHKGSNVPEGMVVGGQSSLSRTKNPMRSSAAFVGGHKKLLLASVVVVAIIAAGVAFWPRHNNKPKGDPGVISSAMSSKLDSAHGYIASGDTAKATKAYETAKANATNDKERAAIELGLANAATNSGDYKGAISHAKASNAILETPAAYATQGFAAEQLKDWQLAADSFAKAADLSPHSTSASQGDPYNTYKHMEQEARAQL